MTPATRSVLAVRVLLGGIGVMAIGYGVLRIFTDAKDTKPIALARWLIATLLVHDVVIAPVVIGLGWLLARLVPGRLRRYLQAILICGGLVSAVGVWLIWRHGRTSSPALALLRQNYAANLVLLLAAIVVVGLAGYALEVGRASRRKSRPPADQ